MLPHELLPDFGRFNALKDALSFPDWVVKRGATEGLRAMQCCLNAIESSVWEMSPLALAVVGIRHVSRLPEVGRGVQMYLSISNQRLCGAR